LPLRALTRRARNGNAATPNAFARPQARSLPPGCQTTLHKASLHAQGWVGRASNCCIPRCGLAASLAVAWQLPWLWPGSSPRCGLAAARIAGLAPAACPAVAEAKACRRAGSTHCCGRGAPCMGPCSFREQLPPLLLLQGRHAGELAAYIAEAEAQRACGGGLGPGSFRTQLLDCLYRCGTEGKFALQATLTADRLRCCECTCGLRSIHCPKRDFVLQLQYGPHGCSLEQAPPSCVLATAKGLDSDLCLPRLDMDDVLPVHGDTVIFCREPSRSPLCTWLCSIAPLPPVGTSVIRRPSSSTQLESAQSSGGAASLALAHDVFIGEQQLLSGEGTARIHMPFAWLPACS
jgi:hypothetical protein